MEIAFALLGASRFPGLRQLDDDELASTLEQTARRVQRSIHSWLTVVDFLDLFESRASPAAQISRILELHRRAPDGVPLLIFYLGHGIVLPDQRYALALYGSRDATRAASSLRIGDLGHALEDAGAHRTRTIVLVLDACFAGRAARELNGGADTLFAGQEEEFCGLALLAAASRRHRALVQTTGHSTMFSAAFLATLEEGGPPAAPALSLREIADLVWERLRREHGREAVRPEIHSIALLDGDPAERRMFPNRAFVAQTSPPIDEVAEADAQVGAGVLFVSDSDTDDGCIQAVLRSRGIPFVEESVLQILSEKRIVALLQANPPFIVLPLSLPEGATLRLAAQACRLGTLCDTRLILRSRTSLPKTVLACLFDEILSPDSTVDSLVSAVVDKTRRRTPDLTVVQDAVRKALEGEPTFSELPKTLDTLVHGVRTNPRGTLRTNEKMPPPPEVSEPMSRWHGDTGFVEMPESVRDTGFALSGIRVRLMRELRSPNGLVVISEGLIEGDPVSFPVRILSTTAPRAGVPYEHVRETAEKCLVHAAKLGAMLPHPNLSAPIAFLRTRNGGVHLLFQDDRGCLLSQALSAVAQERGFLAVPVAVDICATVCEVVHALHELVDTDGEKLGVVYERLSPEAVFITRFGQIRLLPPIGARSRIDGSARGESWYPRELPYIAPEVAWGGTSDSRSDIFSLGVVLWESLTLTPLFSRDGRAPDVVYSIRNFGGPAPVSSMRSDCDEVLDSILARALAPQPADRFQTMREFRRALLSYRYSEWGVSDSDLVAQLAALAAER
ncbi:MAG: hypothetical protein VYE22_24235 [Myxococcota bacterium]|nr:hypothetical protein [Myxococcota bacterium]